MKLIKKSLLFFSLASFALSNLEAKAVDLFLDHKIKENYNLQEQIPIKNIEHLDAQLLSSCFQQLKIENVGSNPILNCFPYTNGARPLSIQSLARKLAKKPYPLLALYQLLKESVVFDESLVTETCHPLDLLNFKGVCHPKNFNEQFLKLCKVVGIETRLANVQGQEVYDFCLGEEWNFLDIKNNQHYLKLDNEKLASSEEVMDDPFLALRTKHTRYAKQIDFKETWKQLAAFDILQPASAIPLSQKKEKLTDRARGVDLFPGEALIFKTAANQPELAPYQCAIEHHIDFDSRQVYSNWKYISAFPINHLTNHTTTSIHLIDQNVELQPGESFTFKESLFQITLSSEKKSDGRLIISGIGAWTLFPALAYGNNMIHLGSKRNHSRIHFHYEINDVIAHNSIPVPKIINESQTFDHCSPQFLLSSAHAEKIWWQIGLDNEFQLVPSNLDQIEKASSVISLPLISETFLNPETTYYFRVKGSQNNQWSDWSTPFAFKVNKPLSVEKVIFEQTDDHKYELNWERCAEESNGSIEYLVFGSNSLDFIPSIYCDRQVNAIVDGEVTDEEINDNLVAITKKAKIQIEGNLAYYRVIARKNGQLSVPSAIIHVYDHELIQPRNVLQLEKIDSQMIAKRTLFPISYPWSVNSLPRISHSTKFENTIVKLQSLLRSAKSFDPKHQYEFPKVEEEIWEEVRPYLLPENHPAWPKLNRVFCAARVTQSTDNFRKAGFRRWNPGRWSRVSASSHPEFPEYFIKAYCDTELGILYDWRKWIHRIKGAEMIRVCIKENKLQNDFKVPHKWIYPLPKHPAPKKGAQYLRKNFILVCENVGILEHSANEAKYKHHITQKLMNGLYIILQVCGLYDSVYIFNMPFCKDGKIAIIDTEYHHKWPVPYSKLTKYFPKSLQSYWKQITHEGGKIPDGKNEFNPPRMDRRDIPGQLPLPNLNKSHH